MSYLLTYTGKQFDLINVEENEIDIVDIAHSLSRVNRYNGHLEYPYSVAEHSLGCYFLAEYLGYSKAIQLYALAHDFSEAYVSDLPKPLKNMLPQFSEFEDRVMNTIITKLGFPLITDEEWEIVKKIDNTMLYLEFKYLAKRDDYPTQYEYLDIDINESAFMDEVTTFGYNPNTNKEELIELFEFLMETQDKLRVVNGDLDEVTTES
jgi:hypothetical protein